MIEDRLNNSKNPDDNIIMGNYQDYKRFIHKCAMDNLKLSDKIIYYCSRWNGLLYKAVYELRLKDVIKTKITTLKVKEYYLKTLLYVRVYDKVYWYDNQGEKVKFKKWVKAK